jgi:uncharacterized protein YutE (UPF0331/DUF86 family)
VVSNDRIRDKIQYIKSNLANINQVGGMTAEEFAQDTIMFHAATRMLQISVEAVLDIAQHIVARKHLGTPKTYREAIELLAKNDILPKEQLPTLTNMVRFRNRVVHLYDEVLPDEVYRIATERLSDFEAFIACIVTYVWETENVGRSS